MYLHVGNGKNIRIKNIIGIFDTDNATLSATTRAFLRQNEKKGLVSSAVNEIPKSFVLYSEGGKHKICFSQLSSASLGGRLESSGFHLDADTKKNKNDRKEIKIWQTTEEEE